MVSRIPGPGSRVSDPTSFHSLSRLAPFDRLPGMNMSSMATRPWLTVVVVAHLITSAIHGMAHVATSWRPLFTTTAVLLALTEAFGVGLALRLVQKSENVS